MFEVVTYGHPSLRKKAAAVERFDDELREFVERLAQTMHVKDGVGLAATQVAVPLRVAVVDVTDGEQPPLVLVNPLIVWSSPESGDYEEGCLSVPDINLCVRRPVEVSVRACDAEGSEYHIEKAGGLLARALQHEIDHLDGILFVDRVSSLQRQLVEGKLKKMARAQRNRSREHR